MPADDCTNREAYRRLHGAHDLVYERLAVGQTDLHIAALVPQKRLALERVLDARAQITRHIGRQPVFLTSLEPLEAPPGAPPIVASMCAASQKAGVGPMAAVAGAIAQYVGEALGAHGGEAIVENGGDLYICSAHERRVAVYAGPSPLSGKLAVTLEPGRRGVATSAGSFGHSLSFGKADAAMVISHDAALADAAATALGNRLMSPDDMEGALDWVLGVRGVLGALCVMGGALGVRGAVTLAKV